jgi:hypothetical protein
MAVDGAQGGEEWGVFRQNAAGTVADGFDGEVEGFIGGLVSKRRCGRVDDPLIKCLAQS